MTDLVVIEQKQRQALTTSLKVAEVFNKRHDRVLRAIEAAISNLPKNGDVEKSFIKTSYKDAKGENRPMYYLNRDGFSFVAMGFTGKKAAEFKWAFIQEFNKMEKALENWQENRASTKITYRKLTDAVQEYIIPLARRLGSTVEDKIFYITYSRLMNGILQIPAGIRDQLTTSQLIMIDQMQSIAAAKIRAGVRRGKDYHEIYQSTKTTLEGYAQVALVAERFQIGV